MKKRRLTASLILTLTSALALSACAKTPASGDLTETTAVPASAEVSDVPSTVEKTDVPEIASVTQTPASSETEPVPEDIPNTPVGGETVFPEINNLIEYNGSSYYPAFYTDPEFVGKSLYVKAAADPAQTEPPSTRNAEDVGDPYIPPLFPQTTAYEVFEIVGVPIDFAVTAKVEGYEGYTTFTNLHMTEEAFRLFLDNCDWDKIRNIHGEDNPKVSEIIKEALSGEKADAPFSERGEEIYSYLFRFDDTGVNGCIAFYEKGYIEISMGDWFSFDSVYEADAGKIAELAD